VGDVGVAELVRGRVEACGFWAGFQTSR
jgi:hypothetical protein